MGLQKFLDDIPMLVFLLLITVLMVSFIEIGFRIGGYDRRDNNPRQKVTRRNSNKWSRNS